MKLLFVLLLITFKYSYSFECKYLPEDQAQKAAQILQNHMKKNQISVIDKYCQSCQNKEVAPILLDKIKSLNSQISGFKYLIINNREADLAHIYVNGESLSYKVNCLSKRSPQFL